MGTNIFIIGTPGSGKSSASLRLGELIAKDLHGETYEVGSRNVCDSLLKVLEFLRDIKKLGEILVIEEVSVLFPSTRAMSGDNVAIAKVMDTIRKKQVIVLSNAPLLTRIDGHMKALGHILIETLRINKTQKVVVSKALKMQTNSASGKTYFHRFQYHNRECHRIYTRMPSSQLWKDYEADKDKFIEKLYQQLKLKVEKQNTKEDREAGIIRPTSVRSSLTAREMEIYGYAQKGINYTQIAKQLGITQSTVSLTMQRIKRKTGVSVIIDKPLDVREIEENMESHI